MKIVINYDLLDKIREAKTGVSLIRSVKRTLFYTGVQSPFIFVDNTISKDSIESIIFDILICLSAHTIFTGLNATALAKIYQYLAINTLDSLLLELNTNCINTNQDILIGSYKYDTEYDFSFYAFPPQIEQKKYIMVPVDDDWGKREISVVQEHIIGTNKYVLSLGTPEEKVYQLLNRKMKQI